MNLFRSSKTWDYSICTTKELSMTRPFWQHRKKNISFIQYTTLIWHRSRCQELNFINIKTHSDILCNKLVQKVQNVPSNTQRNITFFQSIYKLKELYIISWPSTICIMIDIMYAISSLISKRACERRSIKYLSKRNK